MSHPSAPLAPSAPATAAAVWIWDGARRRILAANREALAFWGEESSSELTERDFAPDSVTTRALERLAALAAQAEGAPVESRATLAPQGAPMLLECRARLVEHETERFLIRMEARPAASDADIGMERAAAIFGRAPLAMALFGEGGRLLAQNDESARLFGPPESGELARRFGGRDAARLMLRAAFLDGAYSAAQPILTQDGPRRLRVTARRLDDPAGGAAALVAFSEIPDRRLEAGLFGEQDPVAALRAAFGLESLDLSREGRVTGFTPEAPGLFGRAADLLQGAPAASLLGAEGAEALAKALAEEAPARIEAALAPSGRKVVMALGAAGPRGERRLDAMAAPAAAARPAAASEPALGRLEALDALGHGLRTPLNVVIGRLEEALSAETPDRAALASALEGARHIERLIGQTLDWRRLESGEAEGAGAAPVDLANLVRRVGAEAQAAAARRGVTLVVAVDPALPHVLSEAQALRKALSILADEATRLTPGGGSARLSAWRTPDGGARVEAMDTGPGYTPDEIDRLTRPFAQQTPTPGGDFGGEGLALALARELVEGCGAQFSISSEKGVGAVISAAFPAARSVTAG